MNSFHIWCESSQGSHSSDVCSAWGFGNLATYSRKNGVAYNDVVALAKWQVVLVLHAHAYLETQWLVELHIQSFCESSYYNENSYPTAVEIILKLLYIRYKVTKCSPPRIIWSAWDWRKNYPNFKLSEFSYIYNIYNMKLYVYLKPAPPSSLHI